MSSSPSASFAHARSVYWQRTWLPISERYTDDEKEYPFSKFSIQWIHGLTVPLHPPNIHCFIGYTEVLKGSPTTRVTRSVYRRELDLLLAEFAEYGIPCPSTMVESLEDHFGLRSTEHDAFVGEDDEDVGVPLTWGHFTRGVNAWLRALHQACLQKTFLDHGCALWDPLAPTTAAWQTWEIGVDWHLVDQPILSSKAHTTLLVSLELLPWKWSTLQAHLRHTMVPYYKANATVFAADAQSVFIGTTLQRMIQNLASQGLEGGGPSSAPLHDFLDLIAPYPLEELYNALIYFFYRQHWALVSAVALTIQPPPEKRRRYVEPDAIEWVQRPVLRWVLEFRKPTHRHLQSYSTPWYKQCYDAWKPVVATAHIFQFVGHVALDPHIPERTPWLDLYASKWIGPTPRYPTRISFALDQYRHEYAFLVDTAKGRGVPFPDTLVDALRTYQEQTLLSEEPGSGFAGTFTLLLAQWRICLTAFQDAWIQGWLPGLIPHPVEALKGHNVWQCGVNWYLVPPPPHYDTLCALFMPPLGDTATPLEIPSPPAKIMFPYCSTQVGAQSQHGPLAHRITVHVMTLLRYVCEQWRYRYPLPPTLSEQIYAYQGARFDIYNAFVYWLHQRSMQNAQAQKDRQIVAMAFANLIE